MNLELSSSDMLFRFGISWSMFLIVILFFCILNRFHIFFLMFRVVPIDDYLIAVRLGFGSLNVQILIQSSDLVFKAEV